MSELLKIQQLHVHYGPVEAVRGVDIHVGQQELVTIIGANGAGKTSTLNAVMGLVPISQGSVHYAGQPLPSVVVEERVRRKIAFSPEGRRVFGPLSVVENLRIGGTTLPAREVNPQIQSMLERFPILGERQHQAAGTLSGGEQQMLAIARALMVKPELLILDEPSLGLAPQIVQQVFALIAELHREGVSILLVEQNVNKSLQIADRAYVMELGKVVHQGDAKALRQDPAIQQSYLGGR